MNEIYKRKNKKWIQLFEKYDPDGVGRIATEDFLLAIEHDDFRFDPKVCRKRAALKAKVLEYGTSFITIEEFIQVMNSRTPLSKVVTNCLHSSNAYHSPNSRAMATVYHEYFRSPFGAELYRPHQYHEDIISRHRQIMQQQQQQQQQYLIPQHSTPSETRIAMEQPTMETVSAQYVRVEPCSTTVSQSIPVQQYRQPQLCAHHQMQQSLCSSSVTNTSTSASSDSHSDHFRTKSSKPSVFGRMINTVARHFLPDERDRKYYADMYTCLPPPFFILTITLVELIFFSYYAMTQPAGVSTNGPIPVDSMFIYRPDKRAEVWRFFLYMVLHAGWLHLIFNLLVQLLVGLPLEMVHGSGRICAIYMSGVLAGSLATSVFDSDVYLVGASGGVYALLAAHLANLLLNYRQLELGFLRLVGVFVVVSVDIGIAIYNRYAVAHPESSAVSYVAHLAGAAAGLTIGLLVLKNFEQKLHEQLIWWLALGVYIACILFALVFNVFY